MIDREDIIKIGQFRKPHGTKGEITFSFDFMEDSIRINLPDVMADSIRNPLNNFLICDIDGIFVPFRVEDQRFISDSTAYIKLKNIDSDQKARLFVNKDVYYPIKFISEDGGNDSLTWDFFIDFTIIDEQLGKIGRITAVDKTTINILLIVENEGNEILIPAAEEFIIKIDEFQRELTLSLPEGLIE